MKILICAIKFELVSAYKSEINCMNSFHCLFKMRFPAFFKFQLIIIQKIYFIHSRAVLIMKHYIHPEEFFL